MRCSERLLRSILGNIQWDDFGEKKIKLSFYIRCNILHKSMSKAIGEQYKENKILLQTHVMI